MLKTIAGPFPTSSIAQDTANAIGLNCSVFSTERKDSEGCGIDVYDFYVERDDSIFSGKLFGCDAAEFMKRQYR